MRQAAPLAVPRNGVVGLIADEVGLVVGEISPGSRRSLSSTSPAKRRSRFVEHRAVHLAAVVLEHVRHGVLRDQKTSGAPPLALVEESWMRS